MSRRLDPHTAASAVFYLAPEESFKHLQKKAVSSSSSSSNSEGTYVKKRGVLDVLGGAGRALERGGEELSATLCSERRRLTRTKGDAPCTSSWGAGSPFAREGRG